QPDNAWGGEEYLQIFPFGEWTVLSRQWKTSGYILEIENIPYSFTPAENSVDGTVIGAIDYHGLNTPAFTITAGNTDPDGNGRPAFAIDSATGQLTVNDSGDLDFETNPTFTLSVNAAETGGKSLTSTVQIDLANVDESGNETPTIDDAGFTVVENIANGSAIGTVGGTDVDVGDSLVYAITAGNNDPDGDGNAAFAMDGASGAITVNDSGDLDYEKTPKFTLTVSATDTGGLSGYADIAVALTDINEPVQWQVSNGGNGHFYRAISVPEGVTWDAAKLAAEAAGGHLATITSADESAFIHGLTGSYPDYSWWLGGFQLPNSPEPVGNWQWVTGEDLSYANWSAGEPNNAGGEDFLQLYSNSCWNDLPNQAWVPGYILEIENIPYSFTLAENSADGTVIGAIDYHGLNTPAFTITAGNTDPDGNGRSAFAIDSATGQLTVNDSGDLDFETNPTFTLSVNAAEAGGQSLTNTVQIDLANADEPGNETPIIDDAYFTVVENIANGSAVGMVVGTDIDAGDSLVYTITAGNNDPDGDGKAAFAINSASGAITVNDSGDLDFEKTPNFSMMVSVTDTGGLSDNAGVAVALTDINEPVQWQVSNGGNGHFYQVVSVPEGITWDAAKLAAEAAGGYLATITSAEESAFVYTLESTHTNLWLGGFQPPGSPEPIGNWQWVTGEPFNYMNWSPVQPDNAWSGEDYLQVFPSGDWNDLSRQWNTSGYILEIENIPYSSMPAENSSDAAETCDNIIVEITGINGQLSGLAII
ncbi:MAG: cadherin domain-containing protein, partial [Methylovulum sp.]|nr:cadherin domain-containing protein [Methylovulum sp.]